MDPVQLVHLALGVAEIRKMQLILLEIQPRLLRCIVSDLEDLATALLDLWVPEPQLRHLPPAERTKEPFREP
jgi:hypothetical protein